MFLDKIMDTADPRFFVKPKKKKVSRKVQKERQRQNKNRIIPDNYNNENNATPRTVRKRTRPRMPAVPSTFLRRKDYIQYSLKNDLTGKHLPAFMRHQIDQVKEALKEIQSMRNNTIFKNYCNGSCSLTDMVKLFYQIFGPSGDVVEEYYRIQKHNKNRKKQIVMANNNINRVVNIMYSKCEQQKQELRQSKEVDSDGDCLMAEPKQLTNDESKKQKNEKRQLTRQVNVMIDETKGGHTCFEFVETSSGYKCCCGKDFVYRRRKKSKKKRK